MKLGKAIGTVVLSLLLLFSSSIFLASGLLTFVVLNPNYYKAFVATKTYCSELRDRIGENLDHVAILYGVEEGVLKDVVTDDQICAYTAAMVDALFAESTTDALEIPAYPKEGFAEYLRAHSTYSEKAIEDFSEDCASSVTEDFAALDVGLIVSGFSRIRNSRLASLAPILCLATFVLTAILILMSATAFSEERSIGGVVIWGGLFLGVSTVLVPLAEFWLFDYVGRLNLSIGAFRTILTGLLNTALYGCLSVLGALLIGTFVFLAVFAAIAARGKQKKRRK
ncbi:MAG: hypothetical protein IJK01_03025 [Clostridia bacterium]|nr:hypothetical protein [Clostridia bacterium]